MKPLKDEAEHLNEKCSDVDSDYSTCIDYAKKIMRSVYALYVLARQYPLSPGLHLGYHLNRIFDDHSYMKESTDWPDDPLVVYNYQGPNELTKDFNEYLTKFMVELSNGTLNDVSLLDAPGFGSMSGSLDTDGCNNIL